LKDKYDLNIAATKKQMSGVGGLMNVTRIGKWGEREVDGIKALWVDGSPVDAMECAQAYFHQKFDLVISGLNWGANVGVTLTSGTIAAAHRALAINLAQHGIAISWNYCKTIDWRRRHKGNELLTPYVNYPIKILRKLIGICIKNNLWQAKLLNINLPEQKSNKINFTQPITDLEKCHIYPINLNRENMTYNYPKEYYNLTETNIDYDYVALEKGFITISPYHLGMLDEKIYDKLKGKIITL
jgi:5'/3'-nucleotidase SurE